MIRQQKVLVWIGHNCRRARDAVCDSAGVASKDWLRRGLAGFISMDNDRFQVESRVV
jgi:hypothetical protein